MAKLSTLACAFCQGKGKDPFGIMSKQASCQVCGGTGKTVVAKPHVKCARCQGTGVSPGSRNVCTACNGRGMIAVTDGKKVCSECRGNGSTKESNLPCLKCGGRGVI